MDQYLSNLSTNERILVNTEVEKNSKSSTVAWLLWWFTGTLGGHRYYMGKTGTAILMTILTLTLFGIVISGPWVLIDAFLIGKWIRKSKEDAERQAIRNILMYKNRN
ncbi:TM2 domain-containing protein [Enterococcus mundtii]